MGFRDVISLIGGGLVLAGVAVHPCDYALDRLASSALVGPRAAFPGGVVLHPCETGACGGGDGGVAGVITKLDEDASRLASCALRQAQLAMQEPCLFVLGPEGQAGLRLSLSGDVVALLSQRQGAVEADIGPVQRQRVRAQWRVAGVTCVVTGPYGCLTGLYWAAHVHSVWVDFVFVIIAVCVSELGKGKRAACRGVPSVLTSCGSRIPE